MFLSLVKHKAIFVRPPRDRFAYGQPYWGLGVSLCFVSQGRGGENVMADFWTAHGHLRSLFIQGLRTSGWTSLSLLGLQRPSVLPAALHHVLTLEESCSRRTCVLHLPVFERAHAPFAQYAPFYHSLPASDIIFISISDLF